MSKTWKIKRPGEKEAFWEGDIEVDGGALLLIGFAQPALDNPDQGPIPYLSKAYAAGAWTSVERVEQ